MNDKLRVLYILGHARSGSTILDILLGNHPEIVSTGELVHFYEHAFLDRQYCSCGQPILDCAFWSGVVTRMKAGSDELDVERCLRLQQVFERHRYAPLRALYRAGSRRSQEYQEQLLAHYHAVAAESGRASSSIRRNKPCERCGCRSCRKRATWMHASCSWSAMGAESSGRSRSK